MTETEKDRLDLLEYEIKFKHWNILNKVHDERYDFIKASSIERAIELARFKYGDLINILYVKVFNGSQT